jgi:ParB family transcriptional regulator, chromosome partitioning protein
MVYNVSVNNLWVSGSSVMDVLISAIECSEESRRRSLVLKNVDTLAESIAQIGLLEPIGIKALPDGERYKLLYGYHRLKACERLGWTRIPAREVDEKDNEARAEESRRAAKKGGASESQLADITAELFEALAEIDENLMRADLEAYEYSQHITERKAIYDKLHPSATKAGALVKANEANPNHQSKKGGIVEGLESKRQNDVTIDKAFAADAAAKTGKSRRQIERAAKRGKDIAAVPNHEALAGKKVTAKVLDDIVELHKADATKAQEAIAAFKEDRPQDAKKIIQHKSAAAEKQAKRPGDIGDRERDVELVQNLANEAHKLGYSEAADKIEVLVRETREGLSGDCYSQAEDLLIEAESKEIERLLTYLVSHHSDINTLDFEDIIGTLAPIVKRMEEVSGCNQVCN